MTPPLPFDNREGYDWDAPLLPLDDSFDRDPICSQCLFEFTPELCSCMTAQ